MLNVHVPHLPSLASKCLEEKSKIKSSIEVWLCLQEFEAARISLEPMFYQAGVDVVFVAHGERFCNP